MRSITALSIAAVFAFIGAPAHADTKRATKDEAQAMVKKAVAHYKSAGRDKALSDFSNKSGAFVAGDLYVFVSDFNGRNLAHGVNEKLIGKDLIALKDADGKSFVQEYVERAKSGKSGWTDYKWPNPVTKEIEAKTTYCEPVDTVAVCAGVYK